MLILIKPASAQHIESLYMDDFETGQTIYTITNRQFEKPGDEFKFLNEVTADTSMLYLKVVFHKPDSIDIIALNEVDFLQETSGILEDWLLFVHGDSKTFEQAVMRGFDIQHLHHINVIVFSWPSKDEDINGIKNFKNSKSNVIKSLPHFEKVLEFMSDFRTSNVALSKDKKLSMFVHSLGNSYMENLVKQKRIREDHVVTFDNVILNAAAVNQEGHKDWVEKLCCQKNIYIINNRKDFNLKGVRIFTKDGKQLGEVIEHPIAANAHYVQFTEAVGFRTPTGSTHTFFIGEVADESLKIRKFYTELLHGDEIDLSDESRFEKREDGIGYDIIF